MTLTQLFTAIANAIRGKKGTQATIKAEDFPTEIAGITTGNLTNEEYQEAMNDADDILENTTVPSDTISITSNGSYDVTNYVTASVNTDYNVKVVFSNAKHQLAQAVTEISQINTTGLTDFSYMFQNCNSLLTIPLLDTSSATTTQSMFDNCNSITEIPLLNTGNVTNMNAMFYRCYALTSVPQIDTSKCTNTSSMFSGCNHLTSIPQIDTSNVTNMYYMFGDASLIQTIPLLNTAKVTNMQNMFRNCSALTNDSLNNVLAMCVGASAYSGTKTLKYIGLSSTQATTCTGLSNWSACQSAGWTTGY